MADASGGFLRYTVLRMLEEKDVGFWGSILAVKPLPARSVQRRSEMSIEGTGLASIMWAIHLWEHSMPRVLPLGKAAQQG